MAARDLSGRTLGAFVLHERVDEVGPLAVYRGEQRLLKRDVVVKVLHRQCDDDARELFLREVRLASQLRHYAAHIYSFGCEEGFQWVAMEQVHGVSLQEWLERHGPMPLEQFVPFFECIAQVVQAAHARELVHRALTPANVMVFEEAGWLFPKLDFGIDRIARSDAGRGSSVYRSPEQGNDADAVGAAADTYALGVVAYECLAGRRPYLSENAVTVAMMHIRDPLPPLPNDVPPVA